jgi:hypothetical protein
MTWYWSRWVGASHSNLRNACRVELALKLLTSSSSTRMAVRVRARWHRDRALSYEEHSDATTGQSKRGQSTIQSKVEISAVLAHYLTGKADRYEKLHALVEPVSIDFIDENDGGPRGPFTKAVPEKELSHQGTAGPSSRRTNLPARRRFAG